MENKKTLKFKKDLELKTIMKVNQKLLEKKPLLENEKPLSRTNMIKKIDLKLTDYLLECIELVRENQKDTVSFYEDGSVLFHNRIGTLNYEEYKKDPSNFKMNFKASQNFDEDLFLIKDIEWKHFKKKDTRKRISQINIKPVLFDENKEENYLVKVEFYIRVSSKNGKNQSVYYKDLTPYLVNKNDEKTLLLHLKEIEKGE